MTTETSKLQSQRLEAVDTLIQAFVNTGNVAKLNSVARKYLSPDFTVSNSQVKYGISHLAYLAKCCDLNYHHNISYMYSNLSVSQFLDGLKADGIKIPEIAEWLSKPKKSEVKEEIADVKSVDSRKEGVIVEPKSINAGIKFEVDVASILIDAAKQYLSSEAAGILTHVEERITDAALKLRPTQITVGERKAIEIKGKVHKCLEPLIEILQNERQAFLVGPAGSGKTTLASQSAEALNVGFAHISCTAGMSEAHLLGRMIADGNYIGSEFVKLYEEGGVFLFDEVDAADPNTLLIINSALANGYLSLPNRKDAPKAIRHKDFFAVCAANTYGNGSNQYAGRSILDAAFLDRFCMGKLDVDYDTELEKEILAHNMVLATKLWKIRSNITNLKLRRILSTRAFVSSAINLSAGKGIPQILERFFTGWSSEEKAKALQGV